jgi:Putative porin
MNFKLRNLVAATLAGSFLMGFGVNAMADSTTDIVNALVAKGVLTEEEGALLTKGRTDEAAGQAKALKKAGRVTVSDAIDNATIYGDMRVREEFRQGTGATLTSAAASATVLGVPANANADEKRTRSRGKMTLGVKTSSGDWYTDLAMVAGGAGRTDNFTFGANSNTTLSDKPALNLKRAMIGYKATDWLTLEAGQMENPLYTTPMVWDADLTVAGLAEKVKFNVGNGEVFGNFAQIAYTGDRYVYSNLAAGVGSIASSTNELLAFQGGIKWPLTEKASVKAAVTYYYYTHGDAGTVSSGASVPNNHGVFVPQLGTSNVAKDQSGVNNLSIIEVPAEVNWMMSDSIGMRVYGDYAINTDADARANAAAYQNTSTLQTNGQTYLNASGDDTAWLLGVVVGSAKDLKSFEGNKMKQGDWQARVWYQEVGIYSLDPNTVDSDIFDSRLNMKGTILKAKYNLKDNVVFDFAYGHGTRKNNTVATAFSAGNDLGLNLNNFDLLQLDLTYKF